MINELLWIGLLLLSFFMVILSYRLFGKIGLYVWTAIAVIIANIQVMKTVEIFGLVTAFGTVIYSSLFLVTDILNENHSKKEAQKSVWIGFFVLLSTTLIMQITLFFVPHESSLALSEDIATVFSVLPRIAFASVIAYVISQSHDVWFFNRLKKKQKKDRLWVRNNVSTMVSQLIDNTVFTLVAFIGVFSWDIIAQIFFVSIVMKIVVAVCDTPFVYWARSVKQKKMV